MRLWRDGFRNLVKRVRTFAECLKRICILEQIFEHAEKKTLLSLARFGIDEKELYAIGHLLILANLMR